VEAISERKAKVVTCLHAGDMGDCIAALPIIRTFGLANLVITEKQGASRETMKGNRFKALSPLIAEQPYIESVKWVNKPKNIDYDFSFFQRSGHKYGECLTDWQAKAVGVSDYSFEPWLHVSENTRAAGRVVVSRSNRYHNGLFPWDRVRRIYGEKMLFVGLEHEHELFEKDNGQVEYAPTADLLELAELIAGADMFIGNQSCPMWIAFGLGKRIIQETWLGGPNSCVPNANAIYTRTTEETNKLIEMLGGPKVMKPCPQPVML
jgi:hypothetical protein